jgi:hypothetical protein
MKIYYLLPLSLLFLFSTAPVTAQSAEEIISNYFENTGGLENWNQLNGIKMIAKINQQGMEIPLEIIQLKDGQTNASHKLSRQRN